MKPPHLGPKKVLYAGMGNLPLIGMFSQNRDICEFMLYKILSKFLSSHELKSFKSASYSEGKDLNLQTLFYLFLSSSMT